MIIKVCGMKDAGNIGDVAALGADMVGMVFYNKSPRCAAQPPAGAGLTPKGGRGQQLPAGCLRVGVFVDATVQEIIAMAAAFRLDAVQLHGSEPPAMLDNLRRTLCPDIRPELKIIKAVSIGCAADFEKCAAYEGCADCLLFDTRCAGAGGSGRHFDWKLLDRYTGRLPFILSGGIGPGDEEAVAALRHPRLCGVDLNSRFETAPGIKDVSLLRPFIERLRNAWRQQTGN